MVGYSLRLRRIVVPVHVGVSAGERSRAQDVLLDIDLELPVGRYPATDDLESTVDYGEIVSAADACATEQPYRLLETFVLRVARRLEVCFPQVNTLRVAGTKATVPVLPATQAAIVEVTLGGMTS